MKGAYIMGGYPDLEIFSREYEFLLNSKLDFIEVGIPFNDPIADGAVIASAADEVCSKNTSTDDILDIVVKDGKKGKKIYVMTYCNMIYSYGVENFNNKYSNFLDGLIIADLPNRMHSFFYDMGLRIPIIPFVTPESRDEDLELLDNLRYDFIYFIGLRGITGSKVDFADKCLVDAVSNLKKITGKSVVVGFGIKTADDTKSILAYSDGFVIGTEIVRRQKDFDSFKSFVEEIFH